MKIRTGFVSNSSSASFIIKKYHLSEKQIDDIKKYLAEDNEDGWQTDEDEHIIEGWTSMDNDAFGEWLDKQEGIDRRAISIEGGG